MKVVALVLFGFVYSVSGFVMDESKGGVKSVFSYIENDIVTPHLPSFSEPIMVNLTLIESAASKGAGIYIFIYISLTLTRIFNYIFLFS